MVDRLLSVIKIVLECVRLLLVDAFELSFAVIAWSIVRYAYGQPLMTAANDYLCDGTLAFSVALALFASLRHFLGTLQQAGLIVRIGSMEFYLGLLLPSLSSVGCCIFGAANYSFEMIEGSSIVPNSNIWMGNAMLLMAGLVILFVGHIVNLSVLKEVSQEQ